MNADYDAIILGAGAAGLMCAIEAGKRGRRVLLLDHAKKIGEKIRISGGGRCNFTNIHARPENYLSRNSHFCKSALRQYTQDDFIALVKKHGIAFHEKKLGQLFCDKSAQDIVDMLLAETHAAGVDLRQETTIKKIEYAKPQYSVHTDRGIYRCVSLVVATGGLSIPKIGATGFGYDIARQFGVNVIDTRAGLVPLTFQADYLEFCKNLTGLSVEARICCANMSFSEGLLFTHRGLSGPSILQISSYWQEGQDICIDLAPGIDISAYLKTRKSENPRQEIHTALAEYMPKRLAEALCSLHKTSGRLADIPNKSLDHVAANMNNWHVRPSGTEGYRTAEVTLGGVDTRDLSSKTMEATHQKGLYFIGEVVDVTGHLGGFNFQWAWSSGYVAGQNI